MRIHKISTAIFLAFSFIASTSFSAEADLEAQQRQDHIFFPAGGIALDTEAINQIARVGEILEHPIMQNSCIRLVGFSDASGGIQANRRLSQLRAQAVADALSDVLQDPTRIMEIDGIGEEEFLPNLNQRDPFQRRVAIYLKNCG